MKPKEWLYIKISKINEIKKIKNIFIFKTENLIEKFKNKISQNYG